MMGVDDAGLLDELVRLQVLLLRRTVDTQGELIAELDRAGIGQSRIAQLVGTTPGTVRTTIQRAKKRASAKPNQEPEGA